MDIERKAAYSGKPRHSYVPLELTYKEKEKYEVTADDFISNNQDAVTFVENYDEFGIDKHGFPECYNKTIKDGKLKLKCVQW